MKKILAMYLPQYYEIELNNKWWGNGFTEWTHVKGAKSLFKNHQQPRIPLNNNYYNLLDIDIMKWQAQLALQYGIYGFCFYHYWFEGIQIMEKPVNQWLLHQEIPLHYCFSWANHTWTKAPGHKNREILIEQTYGSEDDWQRHYDYLNQFFKDNRYIKIENKPVLVIYDLETIGCWEKMKTYWDQLARDNGWDGIYYIATLKHSRDLIAAQKAKVNAQFEYQPTFGLRKDKKLDYALYYQLKYTVYNLKIHNHISRFDYHKVWNTIIKKSAKESSDIPTYLGAFTDWDSSARWGHRGSCMTKSSPESFKKYLKMQLQKSSEEYIFLTAWNEWSEGAYLEPDTLNQCSYLESVAQALAEIYEN